MDLSKIESGNYFDPSAAGAGFTLIRHEPGEAPGIQATWYGFDETGRERFLVGLLKPLASGDYLGVMWSAMARGLRPTVVESVEVGTLRLSVEQGQLVATLQVLHSYVHPVDVSPPPPPGALVTAGYWLVRL